MKGALYIVLMGIFLACQTNVLCAQKGLKAKHKKMYVAATKLLQEKEYHSALENFVRLYYVDSSFMELNMNIGICLLHMPGKELQSLPYLKKAREAGLVEAYFYLGRAYHTAQLFAEAIKVFQYYKEKEGRKVSNDEVYRLTQISQQAEERMKHPENVRIKKLPASVNSDYDDYLPIVTAGDSVLFFTSNRYGNVGGKRDASGTFYGDVYRATRSGWDWTGAVNLGEPVNTPEHDQVVGISANGATVNVYRATEGWARGDIYSTRDVIGYWSDPQKYGANINSAAHEEFCSITADETVLYFSSDRPGGLGGKDIYRCVKMGTGDWSLPQNLGATVNTRYDEDAPFIHADGKTLYFSSNGHGTIGGMDIFHATKGTDGIWSVPENIGYPMNTVGDDVYFSINGTKEIGYLASARDHIGGDMDIYSVEFLDQSVKQLVIKGNITDAQTRENLGARITLVDMDSKVLHGIYQSNASSGKYLMVVAPSKNYKMIVELGGYETQVSFISFSSQDETLPIQLSTKTKQRGD